MEKEFKVGDVVVSIAGHDKNRPAVVIAIDKNQEIAIIDGKYRLLNAPKLKNPKHLKIVGHDDKIVEKINSKLSTNAEIYKMIKVYKEKE